MGEQKLHELQQKLKKWWLSDSIMSTDFEIFWLSQIQFLLALVIYWLKLKRASLVAQMVKNLPAMWQTRVLSLSWEDPLEKGKAPHSSILAWRTPGVRKESNIWKLKRFQIKLWNVVLPCLNLHMTIITWNRVHTVTFICSPIFPVPT